MNESDLKQIQARLHRLERQNQNLKRIGISAVFFVIAAAGLIGCYEMINEPSPAHTEKPDKPPRTIEAREIILKDENGITQVRIIAQKAGPRFELHDPKSKAGAILSTGPKMSVDGRLIGGTGVQLFFHDNVENYKHYQSVTIGTCNPAGLEILSPTHRVNLNYGGMSMFKSDVVGGGGSLRSLLNTEGLTLYGGIHPRLEIKNRTESSGSESCNVSLYDKDGQIRAVLGSTSLQNWVYVVEKIRSESSLVLIDKKGDTWDSPIH